MAQLKHGSPYDQGCAGCWCIVLFCVLFLPAWPVSANDESRVKAAFIEKLTRFVDWPVELHDTPATSFVLCLIGRDTLDGALDDLAELVSVKGRSLHVRYLEKARDARGCDVLFVSASMAENLPTLLQLIESRPILTISDSEGFALRGVMINFFVEEGRLRFEINLEAVHAAGIKIGSRVLKLARIVGGEV